MRCMIYDSLTVEVSQKYDIKIGHQGYDDMEEIKFNLNLTLFYSFLSDILYLCK